MSLGGEVGKKKGGPLGDLRMWPITETLSARTKRAGNINMEEKARLTSFEVCQEIPIQKVVSEASRTSKSSQ